jgi:hypothetical protein
VRAPDGVVAEVAEIEGAGVEREQNRGRCERDSQSGDERSQTSGAQGEEGEGRDGGGEERSRLEREPEQDPGGKEPAPVDQNDVGPDEQERREREGLEQREVTEHQAGADVDEKRGKGGCRAEIAPHMPVDQDADRKREDGGEHPRRVPGFAGETEPRAVDVRQQRHLPVEEIPIGQVSMDREPRRIRVDPLVAVDEASERDRHDQRGRSGDRQEDSRRAASV